MKFAFALATVFLLPCAVHAITIDTVLIGNPGNPSRVDGGIVVGGVLSSYRIGATEVTNTQYVQFLNAVAANDTHTLYNTNMSFYSRGGINRNGSSGSYTYSVKPDVPDGGPDDTNYTYGDKPVVFVSWDDAARFTNWLNNGATPTASTETGAYNMADGVSVSRNGAAIWFLPNENQWYKAAYHKNDGATSNYWTYPTASNTTPDNSQPLSETGNSANFLLNNTFTQNESYPLTEAGGYLESQSAYNTFDQGGNVWEWTETYTSSSQTRVRRGGAFDTEAPTLASDYRELKNPLMESEDMGFRVAAFAGIPGDYNGNNVVDAADYVAWRKNFNRAIVIPNDGTPGTVTTGDYDVWRYRFGQSPAAGSESIGMLSAAVPEPTTVALLTVAICAAQFRRRRTRCVSC